MARLRPLAVQRTYSRSRRTGIRAVLALGMLIGAWLGACAEAEAPASRFEPIERPALRLAEGATVGSPAKPWRTIEPAAWAVDGDATAADGPPGDGFEIVARHTQAVPDVGGPAGGQLLKLFGRERKSLALNLPASERRIDRIRMRIAIARFDHLRVEWYREKVLVGTSELPLFPSEAAADCTIDTPGGANREIDRLEFVVPGEGRVALGHIELFELAGEDRLPGPGASPEFVKLGEDIRPAWGVTTARAVEITFTAAKDGVLVASAAVPASMRIAEDRPFLTVRVTGLPGGVRLHRYPLLDVDEWVWVRIPLEEGASRVTARFGLETFASGEAACALTQPQVVRYDERAPTVLFITSDTHRGDHVGFAGSGIPVQTPVLDALAAQGVVFTDAWSATNVTIPSHAAMFTGLPLRDTHVLSNTDALSADAPTLAEVFAAAGYATVAAVSASHVSPDWSGLGQGFERVAVSPLDKRSAGETLAHLERWLPDYRGRPLFVWLHLFDAHATYSPPPPFNTIAWDLKKDPYDPQLPEPPPRSIPKQFHGIRDPDFVLAQYRGEVSYLDSELSRLLARPRFRAATIAFTADHGESLGAQGVYWDHGGLYGGRLHVPLVLRWPGAPAGTRVTQRVQNTDIGRTLLDLAGLRNVEHPGSDLLTRLETARPSEPIFCMSCFGFSAGIADGDDYLVLHLRTHDLQFGLVESTRLGHTVELYDLRQDPECLHDLSAERHERAAQLRQRVIDWLHAGVTKPWNRAPVGSVEVLENLTALGYAGGPVGAADVEFFPDHCDCPECARFAE